MSQEVIINVENLSKTYKIKDRSDASFRDYILNPFKTRQHRKIESLKDVSFKIYKGDVVGILGRNGSGKSTLLKILAGAYLPNKGSKVEVKGKVIRLALGMGFDPELSAKENTYLNASLLGLTFKQIGEKFKDIIEFSELQEFINTKIKYFSSGMVTRLAFAIAIHAEADIFLMDEFFGGVGDLAFQEKSKKVFLNTFIENRTILYVDHDIANIQKYCTRAIILNSGRIIGDGSVEEILPIYKNLFSVSL